MEQLQYPKGEMYPYAEKTPTRDKKGVSIPNCRLGLKVCYPSCYWWIDEKRACCQKLNDCPKIKMILDKDLLDFQYAGAIRAVCAPCDQRK